MRRLTGPRSSCASASAADREDCAARLVRDLRFDEHRRKGRPGDVPIPYAELEQLTCAEIVTVQPLDVVDVRGDCPIKMGIPTDAVRASSHRLGQQWSPLLFAQRPAYAAFRIPFACAHTW
jgi:hypothetical protein